MIFCFVRETKQLTLEEIDRTSPSPSTLPNNLHCTNTIHRGLLRPNQDIYPLRINPNLTMVDQEQEFPQTRRETTANHRHGFECEEGWGDK
jgi:hypothetical protein